MSVLHDPEHFYEDFEMKASLKVGDRVAVYNSDAGIGRTRKVGILKRVDPNGYCEIGLTGISRAGYNIQQCRLIGKKKRKPREIWVNEYDSGFTAGVHLSPEKADHNASPGRIACIKFREVIGEK